MDFERIKEELINFRKERDWQQFHNPKNLSMALAVEASELMEIFMWVNEEQVEDYAQIKRDEIKQELADIFAYLTLLSHELNIDLESATLDKIKINKNKYPIEKSKGNFKKYTELNED